MLCSLMLLKPPSVSRPSLPPSQRGLRTRSCFRRLRAHAADALDNELNLVSVGIDLGTTNSVVALVTPAAGPFCLPIQDDDKLMPSMVAFTEDGDALVGHAAKAQASANPSNTFYSVKRLIGREYDSVAQDLKRLAYSTASDENDTVILKCELCDDGVVSPEEVSAYIIRELLDTVEACAGAAVDRAVISVPAYFDDEQRSATIAAGQIAGLSTVKLIREPIAAAFAYGIDLRGDLTVLVFDLGGGTFDVSILEVGDGVIEVLSTGGDANLGGDDWDAVIMRHIEDNYLTPYGIDVKDPRVRSNVRAIAEAAKIRLSHSEKVTLRIPIGGADGKGSQFTMTRQLLDELAVDLFRRCRLPVDQACWQAGVDLGSVLEAHEKNIAQYRTRRATKRGDAPELNISPKRREPISEVLLVGGATRMPSVKKFVKNMTGLEPREAAVDPDEAVAAGAAIYAGVLSGHVEDLMVLDIWQASLMRAFATNQLKIDPKLEQQVFPSGGPPASETHADAITSSDDDDTSLGEIVSDSESDSDQRVDSPHAAKAVVRI